MVSNYTNTRKYFYFSLLFILLAVVFFLFISIHTAYADELVISESSTVWNGFWNGVGEVLKSEPVSWFTDWTVGNAVKLISWIFFTLSSWFLILSGYVLDASMEMSINTQTLSSLTVIDSSWVLVRDFANMSFIFFLLYMSIATILMLGNYKKALVTLIIAALLINFSLFFTKVVIDSSNIFAVQFYNEASTGSVGGEQLTSISSILMEGLRLESVLDVENIDDIKNFDGAKAYMLGAIVMLVAGFAFLSAAIMFVVRVVMLVLLMIISPLAFAAMALPGTKKYAIMWWDSLLDQAFFAPIFLFFILVVTRILESGQLLKMTGTENSTFANVFQMTDVDDFALLIVYAIILGFILAALIVSKKISGQVASFSIGMAGKIGGGTLGWAGRKYIGGAANRLANSRIFKDKEGKDRAWTGGRTGTLLTSGLLSTSRASFDPSSAMRKLPGMSDIGVSGGKGGYEADQKRKIERDKKTGERLTGEGRKAFLRRRQRGLVPTDPNNPNITAWDRTVGLWDRTLSGVSDKSAEKIVKGIEKLTRKSEKEKADEESHTDMAENIYSEINAGLATPIPGTGSREEIAAMSPKENAEHIKNYRVTIEAELEAAQDKVEHLKNYGGSAADKDIASKALRKARKKLDYLKEYDRLSRTIEQREDYDAAQKARAAAAASRSSGSSSGSGSTP